MLVEDLDRAIKFYRDKIGLRLHQEQEDWAFFEEGVGLMVSPEPLPEDSFRINAVLLSLSVTDAHAASRVLAERFDLMINFDKETPAVELATLAQATEKRGFALT